MPGMIDPSPQGQGLVVYGAGMGRTPRLRQVAANGVHLRLPFQLDFRLDVLLDPDGVHLVNLQALLEADPDTGESFPEPVARTRALLKFRDTARPFEIDLDLRMRDYVTFKRVGGTNPDGQAPAVHASLLSATIAPDEMTPPVEGGH